MADFEYGVAVDTGKPVRGSEMAALMNWLGALISLALIAGLAFWGYQLMVRDVSGVRWCGHCPDQCGWHRKIPAGWTPNIRGWR